MNSARLKKLHALLRDLHKERRSLIQRLTNNRKMACGTVSIVRRKCGNPRCRCADGQGHPQTLFLFKDEGQGRRRCKLVRRGDESWMLEAGQRYREFRKDMMRLRTVDSQEKRILLDMAKLRSISYE